MSGMAEERVRRLADDLIAAYDGDPAAIKAFKGNLSELVSLAARADEYRERLEVLVDAADDSPMWLVPRLADPLLAARVVLGRGEAGGQSQ